MQAMPPLAVIVLATSILHFVQGATKSDYYALYSYLFEGDFYNKNVRPVDNDAQPLNISLQFELLSLVDVNEKAQTLTTTALLDMFWFDDFLSWDPDYHGGIENLLVPQDKIWLPDVVLGNGVNALGQLGYNAFPVRLLSTGHIVWQPIVLLTTACSIRITYFPFDSQECFITFETAQSKREEVSLIIDTVTPFAVYDFSEDGQWELKKTKAVPITNDLNKNEISFIITMSRRRTFYLLTIILPVFFLSVTASLIFALPPDEGEKTGTGMTVLLAFAVNLTIVADLVPNTSLQVSILGLYLTTILGLTAIGLICCVFILRIHYRDSSIPVGRKTIVMVHWLRKLTRMTPVGHGTRHAVISVSPQNDKRPSIIDDLKSERPTSSLDISGSLPESSEDRVTWQVVAATLDWFCYLFFTLCTIIITLGCMLSLEFGSKISREWKD